MDNIINVEVASEFPGGLGYSYFPAAFVLEIGYKQVTMPRWKYKEIIFAVLHVQEMQSERRNEDGSPVGPPDYEYTLDVSYHPLDYIELIVWFAFEEKVFLIIFFIAGFLTILISVILSNINIGGKGNFAFPSPNSSPLPQEINSSYLKLFFCIF